MSFGPTVGQDRFCASLDNESSGGAPVHPEPTCDKGTADHSEPESGALARQPSTPSALVHEEDGERDSDKAEARHEQSLTDDPDVVPETLSTASVVTKSTPTPMK